MLNPRFVFLQLLKYGACVLFTMKDFYEARTVINISACWTKDRYRDHVTSFADRAAVFSLFNLGRVHYTYLLKEPAQSA